MQNIMVKSETMEKYSSDELIDMLEDKTKSMIYDLVADYKYGLLCDILDCESPIERMFAIALSHLLEAQKCSLSDSGIYVIVNNQYDIEVGKNKYRVDFWIETMRDEYIKIFIVECDGHNFHEKSKQQVEKDKKRERELIKAGYTVLRYSGSEIFKDAYKCASEVISIIVDFYKEEP